MMNFLLWTFAVIGVLATLRFIWQLRKLVAAAWRLRKSIHSFQQNRKTAIFKFAVMDEINRRNAERTAATTVTADTSELWDKEEQEN